MDKFSLYERNLKWDFINSVVPSDITTESTGGGLVKAIDLESGGTLSLVCPSYNDQAIVSFPKFVPCKYDEIRIKTLVTKNNENLIFSLGLFTDDSQNGLNFSRDSKASIIVNGATETAVPYTIWYANSPTWFEFIWKPKEGAEWYINERLVGKKSINGLPNPDLSYKHRIFCKNTENTSAFEKKIDVYLTKIDLIVYSQ